MYVTGRSIIQVRVVRVGIAAVTYDIVSHTPVWEVSGSSPCCQGGYRSGDL